jgi:rSAM/selenodomain-associated transferase 1
MQAAPQPVRVVLFTRWPEAGKAKTRLIPALGAQGAADLHRRLTERTVATVRAAGLHLEIRSTGAEQAAFREWLGIETVVDQGEGDLGARLARAAEQMPVLLLGADIPGLLPQHLGEAAAALAHHPAVIGPANDGGYWLLGLAAPQPAVFCDVEWGTDSVLATTLARLPAETPRLEMLSDLDTPDDLVNWPGL